jgi:hypothetical protein
MCLISIEAKLIEAARRKGLTIVITEMFVQVNL